MNRRPWPILALALFQWLSPVGDWLTSSLASHLSPFRYLMLAVSEEGISGYLLHSWAPSLLAGFALVRMKSWSYPVFLACLLYGSYRTAVSGVGALAWGASPHEWLAHVGSITLTTLPCLVNLGLAAWFLMPEVRKPFLNPKLRWWESPPRFSLTLSGRIFPALSEKKGARIKIQNLSQGGALLELSSPHSIPTENALLIGFPAMLSPEPKNLARGVASDQSPWVFSEVKVVHRKEQGKILQVGVEFEGMSSRSRKNLLKLLKVCRELGIPELREKTGFWADLSHGVRKLRDHSRSPSESAPQAAVVAITPTAPQEIKVEERRIA